MAPVDPGRQLQRFVASPTGFCAALASVALWADAGVARPALRATDDAGAAVPGQRWAVAAVSRTSKPADATRHPDWCAPDRCGHLVPPLMAHMARRHRGPMYRVGDARASGHIVTYLIGADATAPLIAVHATCRAGMGWAELPLPQVAQLVEHLRGLLKQAGGQQGADDE